MKKGKGFYIVSLVCGIAIAFALVSCDAAGSIVGDRDEIWQRVRENRSYTVTFNANGGSPAPGSQTVWYGKNATRPDNPEKEESSFVQWSKDDGSAWDFNSDVVTKDITLHAAWAGLQVTQINIIFRPNNGSVIDDKVIEIGEKIIQPEGLVLTRAYLEGWYTSSSFAGGARWDFGDPSPDAKSLTLYAKWEALEGTHYTVRFIAGGGFPAPYDLPVKGGETFSPPKAMTKGVVIGPDAETFGGWYKDANRTIPWIFEVDTVTSSIPLYARWNPYGEFTVNFWAGPPDTFGNTGSPLWHQMIIKGETKITEAIPTAKTGYTVEGWYTDPPSLNNKWVFGADVTQNYTMQAKWTPITYTVKFNANGGTGSMSDQSFTYDAAKNLTANGFERTGCSFAGWATSQTGAVVYTDGQSVSNLTAEKDGTFNLYAKWEGSSFTSTSGIDMVWVPGGSFQLGKELNPAVGGSDVTPVSSVTISGFYMGKYPVTQAQYEAVMVDNPSSFKTPVSPETSTANRPVETVSWYDAIVFCNRLSTAEGLSPAYEMQTLSDTGVRSTDYTTWGTIPDSRDDRWDEARIVAGSTGYRLPTEAQWEYAAKGGNGSPGSYTYSGSNDPDEVAWYSGNSGNRTHEVGLLKENSLGIYDMSGNVYEWCWDRYVAYPKEKETDPEGPPSGNIRVSRGGSWDNFSAYARSVGRRGTNPSYGRNYSGFRLARPQF